MVMVAFKFSQQSIKGQWAVISASTPPVQIKSQARDKGDFHAPNSRLQELIDRLCLLVVGHSRCYCGRPSTLTVMLPHRRHRPYQFQILASNTLTSLILQQKKSGHAQWNGPDSF
jgi:hypothetical protein